MKKLKLYENISIILIIFSLLLVFNGVFQYSVDHKQTVLESFFIAFYAAFAYIGGNGLFNEEFPSYMNIAAFFIPIGVTMGIISLFYYRLKRWLYKKIKTGDYYLIIGFEQYGYSFYSNYTNDKKIYILCEDISSHFALKAIENGALVYEKSTEFIEELVPKASSIYLLDDSDMKNIGIAMKINNLKHKDDQKKKLYIHLKSKEFELFYSPVFTQSPEEYEIIPFNIYQKSVMQWFNKHNIEGCINTTVESADTVAILLVGWDESVKEALYHILNSGHFYNEKPIKVVIAVDDVEPIKQEIQFSYPRIFDYMDEANHLNQKLWDVEICDLQLYYSELSFNFTNILISLDTIEKTTHVAYKFLDLHLESLEKYHTRIGIFSNHFVFQKSIGDDVKIETFGNFKELFVEEIINDQELNNSSKGLRALYEKNQKKDNIIDPWEESIFNYWSNAYAFLHGKIKAREFKYFLQEDTETIDKKEVIEKIGKLYKGKILDAYVNVLANIGAESLDDKIEILTQFTKVEHTRWNVYHILNGYIHGIKKEKQYKKHNCLASWDVIKHDYSHTIKYDMENILNSIGYLK